jgi:DNA repair protein RadC
LILETRRQKSGCKAPAQPPADRGDKGNTEATGSVIANWVEEEQPRARLSRYGAGQMSTAELLGICLVSGVPGEDAVQLARRLLSEFGGIGGVLSAPLHHLLKVRGVGLAKASQIKAIQELAARDAEIGLTRAQKFSDPGAVGDYLRKRMGSLPHEAFACLFLNAKHELLGFEVLFRGSIDRTHVHAREVLKRGLELNAAAVIVSHNHPSGSTEPSQADIALTRSLSNLLQQVEIRLLDHVVVGAGGWVSLHTRGLI